SRLGRRRVGGQDAAAAGLLQALYREDPAGGGRRSHGHAHRTDRRNRGIVSRPVRAFFSEVGTGSRQENASNQKSRAPFRFNRNGKGSRRAPGPFAILIPRSSRRRWSNWTP